MKHVHHNPYIARTWEQVAQEYAKRTGTKLSSVWAQTICEQALKKLPESALRELATLVREMR